MIFNFEKINENAKIPTRAYMDDSGADLYSAEHVIIPPNYVMSVSTGLKFQLKKRTPLDKINDWFSYICGFRIVIEAQIRPKSGLALNKWITIQNTPGTVDMGYTGEIKVIIKNDGENPYEIRVGDKIAQIVFCPVIIPHKLVEDEIDDNTDRQSGGFGSTGLK